MISAQSSSVRGVRLPSRFDPEVSFAIERAAARAWPADEVEEVEGWLLRRTEGVNRRRSNSLLPPPSCVDAVRTVELALATAEELGVAPVIQVSPAEVHLGLDEALEDRGMTVGGRTLVLAGPLAPRPSPGDVRLGALDDEWVQAWAEVTGGDPAAARATADLVLSQLGDRARYARLGRGGRILAVAVGVLDVDWLGVFSLAVTPAARRRGVASDVMDALEGWALQAGARQLYLQVEADNEAALQLYARRGMTVAHSYHYRSE